MKKRKFPLGLIVILSIAVIAIFTSQYDKPKPKQNYGNTQFPERRPVPGTGNSNLAYSKAVTSSLFRQVDDFINLHKLESTAKGYRLLKNSAVLSEIISDTALGILEQPPTADFIAVVVVNPTASYNGRWKHYQDSSYAGGVFDYSIPAMVLYGGDSSASLRRTVRFLHQCFLYYTYKKATADFSRDSAKVKAEMKAYENIDGTIFKTIGGKTYDDWLKKEINFFNNIASSNNSVNQLLYSFRPYESRLDTAFGQTKQPAEKNFRRFSFGIQAVLGLLNQRHKEKSEAHKLSFICHFLQETREVQSDFRCSF